MQIKHLHLLAVITVLSGLIIMSIPEISYAQSGTNIIPPCVKTTDGCRVDQLIPMINNLIRWGAGISGAVALLMYVIGGMWMIFSTGISSRVERGKEIVKGTSIALFFILGSWILIQFLLTAFGSKTEITPDKPQTEKPAKTSVIDSNEFHNPNYL